MREQRFVIYQTYGGGWSGAVEFAVGRWPFRRIQHAPVTSGRTPEEVFAALYSKYPDAVISHDPAVTKRYMGSRVGAANAT